MSFLPEQKLRELKEDAKWGRSTETQKRAIQERGKIGTSALSVLEEVKAVSSRDDIREYCQSVINGIANAQTGEAEKINREKRRKKNNRFPKKKRPKAGSQ